MHVSVSCRSYNLNSFPVGEDTTNTGDSKDQVYAEIADTPLSTSTTMAPSHAPVPPHHHYQPPSKHHNGMHPPTDREATGSVNMESATTHYKQSVPTSHEYKALEAVSEPACPYEKPVEALSKAHSIQNGTGAFVDMDTEDSYNEIERARVSSSGPPNTMGNTPGADYSKLNQATPPTPNSEYSHLSNSTAAHHDKATVRAPNHEHSQLSTPAYQELADALCEKQAPNTHEATSDRTTAHSTDGVVHSHPDTLSTESSEYSRLHVEACS